MLQRTHACGELRIEQSGETANLAGWVNNYRDHGTGLVFVDLRDHTGLTQLVFDKEDVPDEIVEAADKLRAEDVVAVKGLVRKRDGGPNPKLPTGEIELVVEQLEVLAKSDTPPFQSGGTSSRSRRRTCAGVRLRALATSSCRADSNKGSSTRCHRAHSFSSRS